MKTRNLKTKTLSILLAIVMVLTILPMSVFAAEPEASYQTVENGEWINGTLADALASVYENGTVKLMKDLTASEDYTLQNVTLDMNGYDVSFVGFYEFEVYDAVNIVNNSNSESIISGDTYYVIVTNTDSNCVVENVSLLSEGFTVSVGQNAIFEIKGINASVKSNAFRPFYVKGKLKIGSDVNIELEEDDRIFQIIYANEFTCVDLSERTDVEGMRFADPGYKFELILPQNYIVKLSDGTLVSTDYVKTTGLEETNATITECNHDTFSYNADENVLTQSCVCGQHSESVTLPVLEDLIYDGTEKVIITTKTSGWNGNVPIVHYSGNRCNVGTFTASITVGDKTATADYTIAKTNPTYTVPTGLTATYGQTLASVVLPEGWIWDDPAASVGNAGTNRFKAIFTPTDTTNYNTVSADVDIAVGKAVITITVDNKTAKQYEDLPSFTFTATGLIQGDTLITNPTISTGADMKSAGEFEIIATGADAGDNYTITYVPGKLTVEAHTEHTGGTATCTENAICSVCAQPYGATLGHDWGNWISDGNGTHSRTCATDANHTETDDCSGGTATCTEKAKCSVCGTTYGNLAEHTYGTEWKSDGTNHWHECTCGAKADEAAHNGGTASCKDKAVCPVCNVAYGELAAHNYKDGKCTVCETTDPNYVPETDSPQTGDNSHMALWFALLFISGGAVITLTVVDRKRRTAKR